MSSAVLLASSFCTTADGAFSHAPAGSSLARRGNAIRPRWFSLGRQEFANVIQFIS
jgi:hypothetical protein